MRKSCYIVLLGIFLPLISGCLSAAFVPNRPPVPLITHQGELNLSGGVHFPEAGGYDFQAVYAAWNHFSLYGAFQLDRFSGLAGSGVAPPSQVDYNNRFFEAGIGYFDSIHWARYEAFFIGGMGNGAGSNPSIHYVDPYSPTSGYTDTTTLNVFRLGLQQNIGIEGSVGALGVGIGLGYERLFNLSRNGTNYQFALSGSELSASSGQELSPQSAFYVEPTVFFRGGWKSVMLMWELWWTYRTNSYPSFGWGNESLTLSLDF